MKDTKEKVPKARDNLSEMVRPGCGVNKPSYIRQWHNRPQIMLFILCYPRYNAQWESVLVFGGHKAFQHLDFHYVK